MKYSENFGFSHKSGILLAISSLPSKYGIGNFGQCAYDFVDFLFETKQKCWQVLPLNPTSYGDSPYQSPASCAGNPYFIDPELLYEEGLLTSDELHSAMNEVNKVDYGWLFNTRFVLLKKAYLRFIPNAKYQNFCKKNKEWLVDYALFMVLKEKHHYVEWTKWSDEYKDIANARKHITELNDEMGFWMFIQFKFFEQWNKLLKYAHSKKIVIIGDMPIYVAHDSMDVWRNPEQFLLDDDYNPVVVAGCPPDDFTPDGQLWGNPIYNWEKMEKDNFSWWLERLKNVFKLYDILRIDHFRGFAGFYTIPYGDINAKRGVWNSAPGLKLFEKVKESFPKAKIIAEDLGFITDDVRELLKETGFPGMKILQFAFFDDDSEYLPRMYKNENCIVYTGSHDSDCTASWFLENNEDVLKRFKIESFKIGGFSNTYILIEMALSSIANLAIIPIQDYLELTNDEGRMNKPSTSTGNWTWRLNSHYQNDELIKKIQDLTIKYKR